MGTPEFAVPALQALIDSRHEVVLVVTQPSRPKGRGLKPVDPPVKTLADANGIPVIQPASVKREPIDAKVRELGVDAIVVVAFGQILPQSLLDAPRLGALNIHASLLPEYRGAAPIQRALMEGRLETGVTIMRVELKLDAGPIISQEVVPIHEDDDALSLASILSYEGARLLTRALEDIEAEGKIEGEPQDEALATHAPPITKEEGRVPWSDPAESIMFRLRGLTPWPGLFTVFRGRRMQITQAEPLAPDEAAEVGADEEMLPGCVSAIMPEFGFAVWTGDGQLLIRRLKMEGKGEMEAEAFLRGQRVEVGERLGVETGDEVE